MDHVDFYSSSQLFNFHIREIIQEIYEQANKQTTKTKKSEGQAISQQGSQQTNKNHNEQKVFQGLTHIDCLIVIACAFIRCVRSCHQDHRNEIGQANSCESV